MIKKALSSEEIYSRIVLAIAERRLMPGARLIEERLVEVTGSSRARVRQVLSRLSHEQLVTLIPNKGACIASPTVEEARELFYTRRLLEPGMAASLATSITPQQLEMLQQHVEQEHQARNNGDSRAIIRLSGEFHMRIAEMVASHMLLRMMRELTSFTCLIITLYDRPNASACADHEHADLLQNLRNGDAEGARKTMLEHLLSIEQALDLTIYEEDLPDFDEIFA